MKTRLIRFFTITFIIYWLAYTCFIIMFRAFSGKEFDILNITLTGLYTSIIIVGFITLGSYQSLKNKFKFLESSEDKEPVFSNKVKGYYENVKIPFEEFKTIFNKNWIITYINSDEKVIKCCRKINIFDWGYGAYLRYDETNYTLNCIFFQ